MFFYNEHCGIEAAWLNNVCEVAAAAAGINMLHLTSMNMDDFQYHESNCDDRISKYCYSNMWLKTNVAHNTIEQ